MTNCTRENRQTLQMEITTLQGNKAYRDGAFELRAHGLREHRN